MCEIYMVICTKDRKRKYKERFNDYDQALAFAYEKTDKEYCFSLILQLDQTSLNWKKRLTLYPSENC